VLPKPNGHEAITGIAIELQLKANILLRAWSQIGHAVVLNRAFLELN
jgi:hypothetical protein